MGGTSTKVSSSEEEYQSAVRLFEEKMNLDHEHRKLLKESVVLPCNVAELPENTGKNRHLNECFDYNRMILPEKNGSDFINASWVDGYKAPGKFLLCQAPLRETAQDWWAMILANKIRVIVMLTRIVERDSEACFPYWSQIVRTSVNFGEYSVKTKKIKVFKDHIVSRLRVRNDSGASLVVKHFAYTDWPSQGVPQDPARFYDFFLKVRKAQSKAEHHQSDFLPVLVHSSSGLNRAATFAAIDICFAQFDECKTIDLLSIVRSLRRQRRNCFLWSQHYVFCHNLVLNNSLL